ncbi:MAG: 23S rRNA (uracil(1939)-C(5))-methyltransferase RlmD [Calditrichales bacterium]|nr:MAG: 23S rRNA (uracil(1939)-C(5))-methyltransferase RlmD [Calditrichales bacterium]
MNERVYPVKKKEILELRIEKLAFGGKGIGKIADYVIFVKEAIPGDLVQAQIFKRKSNFAEARLLKVIEPSPLRQEAPCPYFGWCGGCTWQNLSYKEQLRIKKEQVDESIRHLAGQEAVQVRDTLPSLNIWGYRNKMEFSFSDRRWLLPEELNNPLIKNDFALGLHIPGTFDKILDINACMLQSESANQILRIVNEYCREKELPAYGIRSHEGFMRFLVIRQSHANSGIMVNLVTASREPELLKPLAEILLKNVPEIVSISNIINLQKAQVAFGEEEILLAGQSFITDKIGEYEFKISANSFFQTNTVQAEQLYAVVLEYAGLTGNEVVWDLYAGTGTISLFLARKAKIVYALELIDSAVNDGKKNALEHKAENIRFIAGDLLHNLKGISAKADVIVVDPPRSGMHPKVSEFLADSEAERIIYVSCNPTTMARDIQILSRTFRAVKVQPVDMFPHTYHIESVCLLERIK